MVPVTHRWTAGDEECRRGDSCSQPATYCLCIVSSPCLNRYFLLSKSSNDSSFDSLSVGVSPKSPDHHDVHTECISIQTHREAQSPTISEDVWNFVIRCSLCQSKHKTFDVLISRLRIVFLELILFLHPQGALMSSHYCSLFPRIHDCLNNTNTSALVSHAWLPDIGLVCVELSSCMEKRS
jgi:hypothetical protein